MKAVERYWSLREQAAYLRSPERRSGPSVQEAEEAALALEREAEELSEAIYDAGNALYARLETWIAYNSGICDPKDLAAIDKWRAISTS